MSTKLFYCFDKTNKLAISYGPIPETWRNITGLTDEFEGNFNDLNYAGHNFGFLTEEQVLADGANLSQLAEVKNNFEAVQWNLVRLERNEKLRNSDWTELPSAVGSKSDEWKNNWAVYRNDLRNITNQQDPFNVVWPTAPI